MANLGPLVETSDIKNMKELTCKTFKVFDVMASQEKFAGVHHAAIHADLLIAHRGIVDTALPRSPRKGQPTKKLKPALNRDEECDGDLLCSEDEESLD